MTQSIPSPPHQDSPLVDRSPRMAWEWYDWIFKLLRTLRLNTPLTGTVTFAAATTAAVTFDTAEASADYNVILDIPENRTAWVTSKATTGFTVNVSSSSSATYGWTLVRR